MKHMLTFPTRTVCLIIFIILISRIAFADAPSSSSDLDQKILKQLSELHKEIKALRQEVGQLWNAVTDIHRRTVEAPSQAPPPPVTRTVTLEGGPILGDSEAKVGIVEFSDYQCPFCRRFDMQTFDKIKEAYIDTGKVQYLFRDFPLQFHQEAKGAAIAANCAGKQGAYWEMRHALFKNQRNLGPGLYEEAARSLKLDLQVFQACLQEPRQAQDVEDNIAYGESLGVNGAPHFFVGRIKEGKLVEARPINGAQPWTVFKQTIGSFIKDKE